MKTFKVLSLLLSYPEAEMIAHGAELAEVLEQEAVLPANARRAVAGFIGELRQLDLMDAQERYVGLFDRNRSLSLHLYEHIHGESRDRGQAMVQLADKPRHGTARTGREQRLPLQLLGQLRTMGDQLCFGIAQQKREYLEGLHQRGSTGCLTPWRCFGRPNSSGPLVPPEQPLLKLKPQEFLRSKASSAYSRWVVGITKRSS